MSQLIFNQVNVVFNAVFYNGTQVDKLDMNGTTVV